MKNPAIFLCAVFFLLLSGIAQAYVAIVDLGAGFGDSNILGITDSQQVGFVIPFGGNNTAAVWTGAPSTFQNLGFGQIFGTDGSEQVGWTLINGSQRAVRWVRGRPTPLIQPRDTLASVAMALHGPTAGGFFVTNGGQQRALFWNGQDAIDLHPLGTSSNSTSLVAGVSKGVQVGQACLPNCSAVVWHNTRASGNSVHPVGYQSSSIRGLHQNWAVGWAFNSSGVQHAAMWDLSVNPPAFFDVHPGGTASSGLNAVHHSMGAGVVVTASGVAHAAIFTIIGGFGDLHSILDFLAPGQYSNSAAFSIWNDPNSGGFTYVGGFATSTSNGLRHAMMWILQ